MKRAAIGMAVLVAPWILLAPWLPGRIGSHWSLGDSRPDGFTGVTPFVVAMAATWLVLWGAVGASAWWWRNEPEVRGGKVVGAAWAMGLFLGLNLTTLLVNLGDQRLTPVRLLPALLLSFAVAALADRRLRS